VVTEYLGWRWIFTGNAVVALLVGVSVRTLLPGGTGDRRVRVEPASALLAVVATVATVWSLHGTLTHGWWSVHTAAWLAVALGALVGCVVVARRGRAPLVPVSLLRDRAVVVADLCGALVGAALLGTFYFVSLHLQQVLGYAPMQAAWSYLPLVAGLVLSAGVGSGVLPRVGARPLLVAGMAGCAAGLLLLAALGIEDHRSAFATSLLPGLAVSGLGLGLAFVALTATAVPGGEGTSDGGAASGLYNTALQVGGALGIAVLATIATARMQSRVEDGLTVARAVTEGRDLALVVASALLLLGVLLALRMPRAAGRAASPRTEAG
jgi:predicted MFS family arabinose efflux permease